jgi:hypothetical protein
VLGKSNGSLVCPGHERSEEFTGGVNGGRRRLARLLGRAREGEGGFIGSGTCRGGSASPSWSTGASAWAQGGGDVRRSDGQWRKAARAGASVLWPRGTGLNLHACVMDSSA